VLPQDEYGRSHLACQKDSDDLEQEGHLQGLLSACYPDKNSSPHTVTESHDAIQSIKDDWVINHPIIVQLTKVLDLRKTSLVEFEVILLKTKHNVFQNIVDDFCDKILMVTIQSTSQNSK
jgi:hypothetical protein